MMMLMFRTFLLCLALGQVAGFQALKTTMPVSSSCSTGSTLSQLNAHHRNNKNEAQKLAAGIVAAATIWASCLPLAPAIAFDGMSSSPTLIAARSGGRAGGRAPSRPMSRSMPPPRTTYRSSTTIVRPMIATPPIVVSPFGGGMGYGYGYNPLGGFGLGYGLGAMNNAGDSYRDYRQESEIQRDRAELEVEKQKSKDLEARLRALEQAQQGNVQAQQQLQLQPAAAAVAK
jgi:hypothetical protein